MSFGMVKHDNVHCATAGALPTEGIPCLLKVLLPPTCSGLPSL